MSEKLDQITKRIMERVSGDTQPSYHTHILTNAPIDEELRHKLYARVRYYRDTSISREAPGTNPPAKWVLALSATFSTLLVAAIVVAAALRIPPLILLSAMFLGVVVVNTTRYVTAPYMHEYSLSATELKTIKDGFTVHSMVGGDRYAKTVDYAANILYTISTHPVWVSDICSVDRSKLNVVEEFNGIKEECDSLTALTLKMDLLNSQGTPGAVRDSVPDMESAVDERFTRVVRHVAALELYLAELSKMEAHVYTSEKFRTNVPTDRVIALTESLDELDKQRSMQATLEGDISRATLTPAMREVIESVGAL